MSNMIAELHVGFGSPWLYSCRHRSWYPSLMLAIHRLQHPSAKRTTVRPSAGRSSGRQPRRLLRHAQALLTIHKESDLENAS